jgi:hypothetical protein
LHQLRQLTRDDRVRVALAAGGALFSQPDGLFVGCRKYFRRVSRPAKDCGIDPGVIGKMRDPEATARSRRPRPGREHGRWYARTANAKILLDFIREGFEPGHQACLAAVFIEFQQEPWRTS